jgi:hypothetical protein
MLDCFDLNEDRFEYCGSTVVSINLYRANGEYVAKYLDCLDNVVYTRKFSSYPSLEDMIWA